MAALPISTGYSLFCQQWHMREPAEESQVVLFLGLQINEDSLFSPVRVGLALAFLAAHGSRSPPNGFLALLSPIFPLWSVCERLFVLFFSSFASYALSSCFLLLFRIVTPEKFESKFPSSPPFFFFAEHMASPPLRRGSPVARSHTEKKGDICFSLQEEKYPCHFFSHPIFQFGALDLDPKIPGGGKSLSFFNLFRPPGPEPVYFAWPLSLIFLNANFTSPHDF